MTALEVMRAVAAALGAAGVEYMVVGSLSTSAYGVPRATKDADFVVQFGSSSVADVLRRLGPAFLLEPQMSFETITGTSRHRITHAESGFLIELFLLSDDAHDRERFARRRKVNYGGCDTFIASAEDVIITKLRWSRHGNRAKDIDDVRNVLAVRGDALDWDYIHRRQARSAAARSSSVDCDRSASRRGSMTPLYAYRDRLRQGRYTGVAVTRVERVLKLLDLPREPEPPVPP